MAGEKPEGTDSIIEGAGVSVDDEWDGFADQDDLRGDADLRDASQPNGGTPGSGTRTAPASAPTGEVMGAGEAQSFADRIDGVRGQATDTARDFVAGAKDRAVGGIDDVVRLIEDAAKEVDGRLGNQYGDYIRRASASVAGFSDALRDKDVDSLFADANDLVRKSPSVAIGAAAAIGFLLARVARAGIGETGKTA